MKILKITAVIFLFIQVFLFFKFPACAQEKISMITPHDYIAQEVQEYEDPVENETSYASGKVLEILKETTNQNLSATFHQNQIVQTVKILVLKGEYKGKIITVENQLTANPVYDIKLRPGNRVILNIEKTPKSINFYVADIERYPVLLVTVGVFMLLLIAVGGKKGIGSIISFLITSGLIFFALVPAILAKFPAVPSAVVIAVLSTIVTMAVVGGWNLKSLSATIGTILSVLAAGLLSSVVIYFGSLNGFHNQESTMLWVSRPDLNYTEILVASVIIAALGAIMDVGMSIASSVYELKSVNNFLKTWELFRSGLNVGRDIMGTMANTLILAYIGGSFSLMLLASDAPLIKLINLNSVATEIASALTASIGVILCIPITALISAYFIGGCKNNLN